MPIGYPDLKLKIACTGLEHENYVHILEQKIHVLGGMHTISADNTNKSNKNRSENFSEYIPRAFPYIDMPKAKSKSGLDDLVEKYYELFGKDGKNRPAPTPPNITNG